MGYAEAFQRALDQFHADVRSERIESEDYKLWHVLAAAIEWSEEAGADFDTVLAEVKQYFAETRPTTEETPTC